MRCFNDFLFTLSFLTRLVPSGYSDERGPGRSLTYFAFVGLIIGTVMCLPLFLGLAGRYPLIQALMVLGVGFFVTRGLHWDGWADLWDAWASMAPEERFWEIIKDSRIGSFGVTGLILGFGFQALAMEEIIREGLWIIIVCAVVAGRLNAVCLAFFARNLARPGLGGAFLSGANSGRFLMNLLPSLVFFMLFIDFQLIILSMVLMAAGTFFLYRLGKRNRGVNGDFLGAAIIWGETSVLLGFVLI